MERRTSPDPARSSGEPRRYRFPRAFRLTLAREFQGVYAAKVRKGRGPLTVFATPNLLGHPRLGLSVGRRVGGAVVRNRAKRRIREAFRILRHDLPTGYDFVVCATGRGALELADYQRLLFACCRDLHREWSRRRAGEGP